MAGGKQKGSAKTGGRTKGIPNKATAGIREAIHHVLESNKDNMNEWLKRVAKDNPDKALDLMIKLSEFSIPKLTRTQLQHEGEITNKTITVSFE
jgi:hypothetical protein